jgi:mono/diheme cytochrome c family protein
MRTFTMDRPVSRLGLVSQMLIMGGAALVAASLQPIAAYADSAQVARGKYLVRLGGCTDCHTPGHFLGKPDMSRYLAGSNRSPPRSAQEFDPTAERSRP